MYNTPLINSAAISTGMSDDEIARREQERLYNVNTMDMDVDIDPPFVNVPPLFNPPSTVDIDADAAYALQLQEEEYSRQSLPPVHRPHHRKPSSSSSSSSSIRFEPTARLVEHDAEYAAQLQAEENQRTRRHRQRPALATQRPHARTLDSTQPESIPFPRATLARPHPPNRNQHNGSQNLTNLFQFVAANAFASSASRARRDVQNDSGDFGPNDYERLLELDNQVASTALTQQQIDLLPTEHFHRPKNKSDEENKCSICWDDFEQNQILRRLRCFHLYHRDCIDNWLKDKNQCPICRIPPIQ